MAFTLETKRKQRFDFMRCLYERTEGSEIGLVYIEEVAEEIHLPELETELIALYLADEGLIRIRMQHIISITHLGIDEVETVMGHPDKATEHFPALQSAPVQPVPYRPQSAEVRRDWDKDSERGFGEKNFAPLPPQPVKQPEPVKQPDPVDKAGDDFAALELKHICEAIGLDPSEFTGGATLAPPAPSVKHDVSDDVRKLIEHAQAASTQSPAPPPNTAEPVAAPSRAVTRSRTRTPKPVNRESVPTASSEESDIADLLASLRLRLLKIRLAGEDMGEAQAEIATAIAQLLSPRPKLPIIAVSLRTLLLILEKAGPEALTKDIETSLARIRAFLQQQDV